MKNFFERLANILRAKSALAHLGAKLKQHWTVECFGPDGALKWREVFDNLVVTEGLNTYLDYTLRSGLVSPAWYVGLKGTGAFAAGDLVNSHAGWSEITPYSDANRPAWTPNGAPSGGVISNSSGKAVFNINATSTVFGSFMSDSNTKGGTTGKLLGGDDFTASRGVASGDTLNVQVDCSLT